VKRLHDLIDDRTAIAHWQESALSVYRREWSKRVTCDRWDARLRELCALRAQ
jgi:hypothetical protein